VACLAISSKVSYQSALLKPTLDECHVPDVNFALYGLGDSSYEKFCYAGKILARRMLSLGARLLDGETGAAPTSESVMSEMRQLNIGGEDEKIDSVERDDRDEESGCLAWGDERAADG
jgi:flavodoxin